MIEPTMKDVLTATDKVRHAVEHHTDYESGQLASIVDLLVQIRDRLDILISQDSDEDL